MESRDLQIVQIIKTEVRARGLTINQFAKMLKVSEPTVKRWLSAKGLLLSDWTRMLEVLELSLVDVLSRVENESFGQFEYTEKQEEALSRVAGLLAFFQQLHEGHSVREIMNRHRLSRAAVSYYLKRLDDIDLIRWKDGLDIALLQKGEPRWRRGGLLSKAFRGRVFQELVTANRDSEKMRMAIYRLSPVDFQKMSELQDEVFRFAQGAEKRAKALRAKSKSVAVASVLTEYEADFLSVIPNR